MTVRSFKYFSILALLFLFLMSGWADDAGSALKKDGKLVVLVTWGDVNNTPADDVYIEAYGFVRKYDSEKSFVLKMSAAGRYEASLPPGVYDVFVSEGTSIPRCRRVLISPGFTGYWTLARNGRCVYGEVRRDMAGPPGSQLSSRTRLSLRLYEHPSIRDQLAGNKL